MIDFALLGCRYAFVTLSVTLFKNPESLVNTGLLRLFRLLRTKTPCIYIKGIVFKNKYKKIPMRIIKARNKRNKRNNAVTARLSAI